MSEIIFVLAVAYIVGWGAVLNMFVHLNFNISGGRIERVIYSWLFDYVLALVAAAWPVLALHAGISAVLRRLAEMDGRDE